MTYHCNFYNHFTEISYYIPYISIPCIIVIFLLLVYPIIPPNLNILYNSIPYIIIISLLSLCPYHIPISPHPYIPICYILLYLYIIINKYQVTDERNVHNPFHAFVLFSFPLKTSENQQLSDASGAIERC